MLQNPHHLSQGCQRAQGLRWRVRPAVSLALLILLTAAVAVTVGDAPPATTASRVPDRQAHVAGKWNPKVTLAKTARLPLPRAPGMSTVPLPGISLRSIIQRR